MKKSFRKILSLFVIAAVLISCLVIPASAVTARTNTYYPMQEVTYGQLTLTPSFLTGLTYCELNRAGKIVKVNFSLIRANGLYSYTRNVGGNYDTDSYNATDNNSSNFAEYDYQASSSELFDSARTYHKVRINSYVYWDNAACEGNYNGKDIPAIQLVY